MPANNSIFRPTSLQALAGEANRCVACGLCLPSCPTYRKTESEADSPRGRVMLMRGLFEGGLSVESNLVAHLDACLACRTCEAICPSGVKYGELIDGARAAMAASGHRHRAGARLLPGLLASPVVLGLAARIGFREHYPAHRAAKGKVSLFLGCVSRFADAATLKAEIFILTRLGYEVQVPRTQGCCGAMHQHGGDMGRAKVLADKNIEAFKFGSLAQGTETSPPILFAAAGCGASLIEYDRFGEAGAQIAARAVDIVSFLARVADWDDAQIASLPETILVHEPCSARNVLRNAADAYQLLKRIPEARIVPLAGNDQCCGSAGLYFLNQPEMAEMLRADKMDALQDSEARYLASTNYGCARWLAKGVRRDKLDMEVMHPVVLLAKQMGFTGTC